MLKVYLAIIVLMSFKSSGYCYNLKPIKHIEQNPQHHLQEDLDDFIDLIPLDDIRNLTVYYYANDESMRKSYDFLKGDDYRDVKKDLFGLHEFTLLNDFFKQSGVKIDTLLSRFDRFSLTKAEVNSINVTDSRDMGGINGFFEEAVSMIPQDEFITTFFSKLESSNDFSLFFEKFGNGDFGDVVEHLKNSQGVQKFIVMLKLHGIDLIKWFNVLKAFFGFGSI